MGKVRHPGMKMGLPLLVLLLSWHLMSAGANGAEIESAIDLSNGYRLDQLDWNIAGNLSGRYPNILSELTWEDIESYQLIAGLRALINENLYLRGTMGYGWIFDGSNQDSDFLGNNRTAEFSRSNNASRNGNVFDASLGVGYRFTPIPGKLEFIPLFGFSSSRQNLTITDGCQTISTPGATAPLGPFQDLDSTYDTEWVGPWAGMDLIMLVNPKLTLSAGLEYHWASYKAEANWNLRNAFAHPKSFEHDADGTGLALSLAGEYALRGRWFLILRMGYQEWSTDAGVDRLYFADGSVSETRLNEVNWESFAMGIGLTYRFRMIGLFD